MNASDLARLIRDLPCHDLVLSEVDHLVTGVVRLTTKLMRPDGSFVDVFVAADRGSDFVTVTDFGETWAFLEQISDRTILAEFVALAASYDASVRERSISVMTRPQEIVGAALQVAQACVALSAAGILDRSADAGSSRAVTDRPVTTSARPSVRASVVERLSSLGLEVRPKERVRLRAAGHAYEVQVDFLVTSRAATAALMVVEPSPYDKVVMRHADHAFAIHTDLREAEWDGRRISVFGDVELDRLRGSDSLLRLERVSALVALSDLGRGVNRL